MIATVQVEPLLTEEQADQLQGQQLRAALIPRMFRSSVRVVRADGSLLAVFLRGAVPDEILDPAYSILRRIRSTPSNRAVATVGRKIERLKVDGTKSKTNALSTRYLRRLGLEDASSAIIGYMDRYVRTPFCRKTAFTFHQPDRFSALGAFIRHVNGVFQAEAPERYAAQLEIVEATKPEWLIEGTVFTTVTVNRNYPTRLHKDVGDYKPGFGVMAVMRSGFYTGGVFGIPRYGVGFDCGHGDVLLADVHEWHGNTPIRGIKGRYERVSTVLYYREKMAECQTARSPSRSTSSASAT